MKELVISLLIDALGVTSALYCVWLAYREIGNRKQMASYLRTIELNCGFSPADILRRNEGQSAVERLRVIANISTEFRATPSPFSVVASLLSSPPPVPPEPEVERPTRYERMS
jgi:hypothetical protein